MVAIPHDHKENTPQGKERDGITWPLLYDGCKACEQYAVQLGLGLDASRFRLAWELMLRVEYRDEGAYLSIADRDLGRALHTFSLLMQRHMGLRPEVWPPRPGATYRDGLEDGIRAYAYHSGEPWATNGVQYVGSTGRTLAVALASVESGKYPVQRVDR